MRLGIFGGSFDPVHNGHLALARACQDQAALDEVWFTPTAIQPLKQKGPQASDAQRVEMLNLAIEGEPAWRVCTLEIDRGGFSYTVDTLRQLRVELPEAKLFFLMGADVVRDIGKWKEPAEIFRLATPVVLRRAGDAPSDSSLSQLLTLTSNTPVQVEMPAMDISSSDIRRRVANGEPVHSFVPRPVAEFIAEQQLYR
jgi:nicotinate-nucleotide adenylyltransferase